MSALCCCGSRWKDKHNPEPAVDLHRKPYETEYLPKQPQPTLGTSTREVDAQDEKPAPEEVQSNEIPYGTPARLDELIVNDDDSDAGGQEPQPRLTRRASAALDAVRTRIIRHLSSESDVKRQSTASVGKSQEEVARRAELRRLRHKRIQDELKHDLGHGLKEGLTGKDPTNKPRNASIKSARHASLTSPSQSQPGGGPRDTIEFAVPDSNPVSPRNHSPAPSVASRASLTHENNLPRQRLSVYSHAREDDCNIQKDPTAKSARHAADPQVSEITKISRSIPHSETRSTFRLSSSPSWLDRIIGVDNTFSDTGENPSLDGRSALSIWLAAQGLRSRDNSMQHLDQDVARPESGGIHGAKGGEGFDNLSITVSDVSHRSRCSENPLSNRSGRASPVQMTSCVSSGGVKPGHLPETTTTTDQGALHKSPSEDLALDYAAALAFTSPNDNTSSQYASGAQSLQPSPSRSRANLHRLDTHQLEELQLSPFQWHSNLSIQREAGRSEAQSSYVTAQDHLSAHDLPLVTPSLRYPTIHHDVTDPASPAQSETASFQIREAELQTIEKRFADVLSRRKPAPYTSRFIEDFREPPQPVKKKNLLIPRMIHLHVPGKAKHTPHNISVDRVQGKSSQSLCERRMMSDSQQIHTQQKSSSSEQRASLVAYSSGAPSRIGLEESAMDLWQRALRQEAEQRRATSSKSAMSSRSSPGHSKNPLRQMTDDKLHASTHAYPFGSAQFLEVPGSTKAPSQSKWRIPQWATSGSEKPEYMNKRWPKLPMDLAKAPESWAKYPAYNREERNAHARSEDNVKSHDFAIGPVSPDGQMIWITDKELTTDENIVSRRSASVHSKLGKAVKTGITKLFPFAENLTQSRSNSLGRRRGSFQLAGEVEYPELEVLPPGIGHILEPDQVADAMSSRKRSHASSSRHSFGRYSFTKSPEHRPSASSLMQRQRQVVSSMSNTDPVLYKSVEVLPRTPLKVLDYEDKNSTPKTEVLVTSLSTKPMVEKVYPKQAPNPQLPICKSAQALPYCKRDSQQDEGVAWTRSFTWSGSLSSAQRPAAKSSQRLPEYQVFSRPRKLNASKDSFATGASFTTAAAD